jgi:hypothetical protein
LNAHSVAADADADADADAGEQMVAVAADRAAVDVGEAVAGPAVAVVAGEAAGFGRARGDVDKIVAAGYNQARHHRKEAHCSAVPLMATVVGDDSCCRAGERETAVGGSK